MEQVIIGVDPHKLSATIEVVDHHEKLLGSGRFTTDQAGYVAMRAFAASWPERVWAVEGANGAGRHLVQRLLEAGEHVVDVPAKLAARVRLFDTGHNRKTDVLDAHSIAIVAVRTEDLRVLKVDAELEAMRMPTDRRKALTRRRVQIVNRLQALLAELLPGQAKKDITPMQAKTMLASVRPPDIAGKTRRRIAAEELAELIAVKSKIKKATAELKAMVLARDSRLMNIPGVGPVVAARILADVGDVARFTDRNRFASWTGTAPLDAVSGEQNRHRLSRAGNRRINHMIHIAAVTQIRLDTEGHAYYRRKREDGKKPIEAMRCLKRRISDAIYCHLVADAGHAALPAAPGADEHGPGRALRGVSRIQRGRPSPAHQHFGSATSRTRIHDATPTVQTPKGLNGTRAQSDRLTIKGSRNDSAVWAVPTADAGSTYSRAASKPPFGYDQDRRHSYTIHADLDISAKGTHAMARLASACRRFTARTTTSDSAGASIQARSSQPRSTLNPLFNQRHPMPTNPCQHSLDSSSSTTTYDRRRNPESVRANLIKIAGLDDRARQTSAQVASSDAMKELIRAGESR